MTESPREHWERVWTHGTFTSRTRIVVLAVLVVLLLAVSIEAVMHGALAVIAWIVELLRAVTS